MTLHRRRRGLVKQFERKGMHEKALIIAWRDKGLGIQAGYSLLWRGATLGGITIGAPLAGV
jgi:hypothetical protein